MSIIGRMIILEISNNRRAEIKSCVISVLEEYGQPFVPVASCIFSCYRKTTIGIRQTIYLVDRHDRKSDSWRKRVQRIHVQPILRRLLSYCRNGIGYRVYMANHHLLPLFSHRCMCHSRMAEKKIIRLNHIIGIFKLTLNFGQRFKVRIIFLCHDF